MSTIVDLDTGQVFGVGDWLKSRSPQCRDRIEVVAIRPSTAFAKAIRTQLPTGAVSVDAFELIKLAMTSSILCGDGFRNRRRVLVVDLLLRRRLTGGYCRR